MGLGDSLSIAAAGMRAQGDRLRVISENVANANST
ncbi:MAG: flagellar basal body rod protein FlgC, partial [Proteobacteria bacterium]|nr:flagellar basal body rod protein FlgC [Pseudomonadota bacterium]